MKPLFFFSFIFLFSLSAIVFAAGEGTYGNETYGNFSYGVSSSSSGSFSNNSVPVPANTSVIINATQGATSPNTTLELVTNSNASGSVTLVKYDSYPPSTSTNTFASPLNKYVDVVVDSSISSQLNYSIIKMYYSDTEVSAANLQESTMRLSRWNGSQWVKFDDPVGGVDTVNNFVWANTSSFSTWGIFGAGVPSPRSTGGGGVDGGSGGGGGSGFDWQCTKWSDCSPAGTQTRTCVQVFGSGAPPKPAESQACTYKAPTTIEKPKEAATEKAAATPEAAKSPQIPSVPAAPSQTGLAALTGKAISALKQPSMIAAIVASVLVLVGLFIGHHYFYKRKQ